MVKTIKIVVILVLLLIAGTALAGKNCVTGPFEWCTGSPDGSGCWACAYETRSECEQKKSFGYICVHRSQAR